jgi:hypothetical protein
MRYLSFRFYVVVSVVMMALGISLAAQRFMDRRSFDSVWGTITYLGDRWKDLPSEHPGKFRYVVVDTYPDPFELFVGKAPGDFSPAFEKIDSLTVGQRILIYYAEPSDVPEHVNRTAQFIESNGTLYFERGNAALYIGVSIVAISGLLLCFLLYSKRRGWVA